MPTYADAIASIESGGRYDRLGPVTRTGDQAYGKYQVMGANIPEWTRAALGQSLTPQQFLASPEAQEAVFQHRFGQYAAKHGPEGAARAWFAGEGGMNDPNRRDVLGTSVADYSRKFTTALGGVPTAPGLLDRPTDPAGLLETPPAMPQRGPDLMHLGQGLMFGGAMPMAPAPAFLPPMPKRPIDLSALRALAQI